jgi:hypothetical protein
MKHSCLSCLVLVVLLFAAAFLCGCVQVTVLPETTVSPADTASPTPVPSPTAAPTPEATAPPATAPAATAAPSPTASNPSMYSSYADLVSFDPSTGVAQFDYFDLLRGDDAVNYLVDHDGYTKAKAQAMVDEFAESEFVKKNDNPKLRAIDLDDVSLKMMIQPSGEPVDGAESIPASGADVRAIYAADPAMLSMYFYYIHVESDGQISLVEQVYWP